MCYFSDSIKTVEFLATHNKRFNLERHSWKIILRWMSPKFIISLIISPKYFHLCEKLTKNCCSIFIMRMGGNLQLWLSHHQSLYLSKCGMFHTEFTVQNQKAKSEGKIDLYLVPEDNKYKKYKYFFSLHLVFTYAGQIESKLIPNISRRKWFCVV